MPTDHPRRRPSSRWIGALLGLAVLASMARAAPPTVDFQDILPDDPDRAAINRAVQAGILQGYDGRFHPAKVVNRYQWAVVIARLLGDATASKGVTIRGPVPPDVPKGHWAYDAVSVALPALGRDTSKPLWGGRVLSVAELDDDVRRLLTRRDVSRVGLPEARDSKAAARRRDVARAVQLILDKVWPRPAK